MHRKTLLAAALCATFATAAVAAPQTGNDEGRPARVKLDANNDGSIDKTEAAKHPRFAARFDELDRNGDGKLGADERPHWKRGGHGRHGGRHGGIERLDKDGDGRISRTEFDAGKAEREARMAGKSGGDDRRSRHAFDFAAADANRDGYLVRSEMRAYHERMRPQREAEFAKRARERFAAADINKDGRLSRLEVGEKMPRMEKSFAWMDENRDGFLSEQEMRPQRHR